MQQDLERKLRRRPPGKPRTSRPSRCPASARASPRARSPGCGRSSTPPRCGRSSSRRRRSGWPADATTRPPSCRRSRRGSSPSSKATRPSPASTGRWPSWQQQLNYLLELNGDPNNPGVKELQQKIAEAAQERERIRKERIEEFQKTQLQEVARKLQADDEKIDADLAGLKIVQEKTRTEMKEYEAKLAKILPEARRPEGLRQGRYARASPRSSAG